MKVVEVIYFALAVGVCLLIGLLKISITDIININGAVIGFFFIYFLPALLHIKCMYFSKGKRPVPKIEMKIEEERRETDIEIQTSVVVMKVEETLNRALLE